MIIFLTVLHILVCLFLIFIVLIQSGKGAEMGAAFGGSSQTLFGSRGAATFLSKMTNVAAVLFMITSLSLTMLSTKPSTVIKDMSVPTSPSQTIPQQAPQQIPQEPISNKSKESK
ncbi:MAG TPA: preprotein translocase subunit SecG [Nitrospirae bacterium]|nr:preprotein translocase subunit SecG [Nitrospirota bacterium]